jgi:multidrug efflux pump subunit AcrA (membrane-fusion protein)
MAENNFNKAQALYQEAVRADEALRQQQQFNANLALQYAQLAQQQSQFDAEMSLNYAKAAASASKSGGGSGGSGVGGGGDLYIDAGGGIPALGTDDYYDYIQSAASAAGQSGGDYIVENYKALGIPYSNITGRVNDYNGYLTKKDNYSDLEQRLGLLAGLNREQKYSVIEEAVMSGQITDAQGKALAELYGYL